MLCNSFKNVILRHNLKFVLLITFVQFDHQVRNLLRQKKITNIFECVIVKHLKLSSLWHTQKKQFKKCGWKKLWKHGHEECFYVLNNIMKINFRYFCYQNFETKKEEGRRKIFHFIAIIFVDIGELV
jgi:hypothetical protein